MLEVIGITGLCVFVIMVCILLHFEYVFDVHEQRKHRILKAQNEMLEKLMSRVVR